VGCRGWVHPGHRVAVVILVMIAWRPWSGVLLWPIFFAFLWLLTLVMSAVGYVAQRLKPPAGDSASLGSVAHNAGLCPASMAHAPGDQLGPVLVGCGHRGARDRFPLHTATQRAGARP
jgi:hypothetical protein